MFFKLNLGQWLTGMLGNMQDAIPLTLWIMDLESASEDLGKRSGLGKMKDSDRGAVRSSRVQLANIKTMKIGSFSCQINVHSEELSFGRQYLR